MRGGARAIVLSSETVVSAWKRIAPDDSASGRGSDYRSSFLFVAVAGRLQKIPEQDNKCSYIYDKSVSHLTNRPAV